MTAPLLLPIVLVRIDENSRLEILQTDGVQVVTLDERADPSAVLWPQQDQYPDLLAAVTGLPVMSPGSDDPMQSALFAIRRVRSGFTVVAGTHPLIKLGEPE